jgi:hypothetical protein
MGLKNTLSDEQSIELAGLVLRIRSDFARLTGIIAEATGEDSEQAQGLRRICAAIDILTFFPMSEEKRAEAQADGQKLVDKIVPPGVKLPPFIGPSASAQPRADRAQDDETWDETLRGE